MPTVPACIARSNNAHSHCFNALGSMFNYQACTSIDATARSNCLLRFERSQTCVSALDTSTFCLAIMQHTHKDVLLQCVAGRGVNARCRRSTAQRRWLAGGTSRTAVLSERRKSVTRTAAARRSAPYLYETHTGPCPEPCPESHAAGAPPGAARSWSAGPGSGTGSGSAGAAAAETGRPCDPRPGCSCSALGLGAAPQSCNPA